MISLASSSQRWYGTCPLVYIAWHCLLLKSELPTLLRAFLQVFFTLRQGAHSELYQAFLAEQYTLSTDETCMTGLKSKICNYLVVSSYKVVTILRFSATRRIIYRYFVLVCNHLMWDWKIMSLTLSWHTISPLKMLWALYGHLLSCSTMKVSYWNGMR